MADLRSQVDEAQKMLRTIRQLKEAAQEADSALDRDHLTAALAKRQAAYQELLRSTRDLAKETLSAHAPEQVAAGNLKGAHRAASMATHPDRGGSAEAFKDVTAAFAFLSQLKNVPRQPAPPSPGGGLVPVAPGGSGALTPAPGSGLTPVAPQQIHTPPPANGQIATGGQSQPRLPQAREVLAVEIVSPLPLPVTMAGGGGGGGGGGTRTPTVAPGGGGDWALLALSAAAAPLAIAFKGLTSSADMLGQAMAPFTRLVEMFDPGLVDRFNLALEDLMASAGQIFAPLVQAATTVADTLNAAFTRLAPILTPIVQQIADVLQQLATVALNAFMPAITIAAQTVGQIVQGLAPLVASVAPLLTQLGQLYGQMYAALAPVATSLVPVLADGLRALLPIIGQLAGMLGEAVVGLVGSLAPLVESLLPALSGVLGVVAEALSALLPVVQTSVSEVVAVIARAVQAMLPAIQSVLPALVAMLQQAVAGVALFLPTVSTLVRLLGSILSGTLETFGASLMQSANLFGGLASLLSPLLSTILPPLTSALTGLLNVVNTLIAGFGAAVRTLQYMARTITEVGAWAPARLEAQFRAAFDEIMNGRPTVNTPRPGQQQPLDLSNRTTAARPASIIGIEQIGEQARTAAFSGRTLAERQRDEMIAQLREVARNGNWLARQIAQAQLRTIAQNAIDNGGGF